MEFYANSTLPKVTGMLVKADLGPPRLILAGPLLKVISMVLGIQCDSTIAGSDTV